MPFFTTEVKTKFVDYFSLLKPRLTLLSVFTALGGAYMASHVSVNNLLFLHVFISTFLTGSACAVLNQYAERNYDSKMYRTAKRPLASGRILPHQGLIFGIAIAFVATIYLIYFTNMLSVLLSLITFVLYFGIYTPLKKITAYATFVGSIAGAIPPLIGWSIVRDDLSIEALSLFAIIYFWQLPHFAALSWIFKDDYVRADMKVLSVIDQTGKKVTLHTLIYIIALIPVSLTPTIIGLTVLDYCIGALLLGFAFLILAIKFRKSPTTSTARRLFFYSLFYLLVLFLLMVLLKN